VGGKLVFDWDQQEKFLITRHQLVGNKVTNTKCQTGVSHVQIQDTIALVSDAQIEGKLSVLPKLWLPCIQYLCGICHASLWSAMARGTKGHTYPNLI